MKNKKWGLWIIILLIVLGAVYVIFKPSAKAGTEAQKATRPKMVVPVDGVVIQPTELSQSISVSGSVMASEAVELKSEVSGRIVTLNIKEGEYVKEGTLLVELFNDDLKASLKKLEAHYKIQEQLVQRQSELIKINGISQETYDQTALQLETLAADIEALKAQIRKTKVIAPFNGIVGLRQVSPGAIVSTSTVLTTLRNTDYLKLDFQIPEKYGALMKPGQKVQFTVYEKEQVYDATLLATEREIDEQNRNLKVRARINNTSENLLPGAFANVTISVGNNPEALIIPTQSIIPSEKVKKVIVAKNGKAHFVNVTTGIRKDTGIEILSGIQAGDTVIRTGILFLKEGDPLTFKTITTDSL